MMRALMLGVIRAYRYLLSPWIGQHCRFHPTCSLYAMEAIETHGPWRGGWLALRRLSRCHPWCDGGLDPVPPRRDATAAGSTVARDEAGGGSAAGHDPATCCGKDHRQSTVN